MYSGHLIHAVPSAVLGNTKIVGRENDNVMIYATSAIGVVHNVKTNTQSFFEGHTDDVCCISMSLDGHTVATGQVGKNPFVLVWQMASLLGCNQDDCEASSRDCLIAMLGGPGMCVCMCVCRYVYVGMCMYICMCRNVCAVC